MSCFFCFYFPGKIRTIVLPIKENEAAVIHETIQQQHQQQQLQPKSEFNDANEYDESDILDANTLMTLTEHNGNNQHAHMDVKNVNNANNKTWQFIESAIGEVTMVNDFYANNAAANANHLNILNTGQNARGVVGVGVASGSGSGGGRSDNMNIETIMQMQCELIDQQKELKSIEMETIEQLKMLHRNVAVLAKKFEIFEHNFNVSLFLYE